MLIPYLCKWIYSIYLSYLIFSSCIDIPIFPASSLKINEFVRLAFDVFLAFTPVGEACGIRAEADDLKKVEFIFGVHCLGMDLGEFRTVFLQEHNTDWQNLFLKALSYVLTCWYFLKRSSSNHYLLLAQNVEAIKHT